MARQSLIGHNPNWESISQDLELGGLFHLWLDNKEFEISRYSNLRIILCNFGGCYNNSGLIVNNNIELQGLIQAIIIIMVFIILVLLWRVR